VVVGMQELRSKATSSTDEDKEKAEDVGPERKQQHFTLLDKLFANPVMDEEEEVEELRTTQFNATQQASQVQHRPPYQSFYSSSSKR
jgi:hypothetical protein